MGSQRGLRFIVSLPEKKVSFGSKLKDLIPRTRKRRDELEKRKIKWRERLYPPHQNA